MPYIADLSSRYPAAGTNTASGAGGTTNNTSSAEKAYGLDMTDFLTLMVAQFQNQSMDATADTSDMLNQLVQMQMVTALVNMTDASLMSYAASLVGKEVTVASYDSEGNLQEIIGQVTATGTYDGEQVVFVNDQYYRMSEILAVGRLPEIVDPEAGGTTGSEGDGAGTENQ